MTGAAATSLSSRRSVNAGLALIRDGNGTRSIQTLMRYRGAAMAEFMRSLRILQTLQAQRQPAAARATLPASPRRPNDPKTSRKDSDLASRPTAPGPRPERAATGPRPAAPEIAVTGSLCGVPPLASCALRSDPGTRPAGGSSVIF